MGLNQKDLTAFIKYLVEVGGPLKVDKDHYICTEDNKQFLVVDTDSQKEYPIKVYHIDREPGDEWVLNPFKEQLPKQRGANKDATVEGDKVFFQELIRAKVNRIFKKTVSYILTMDNTSKEYQKVANLLSGALPSTKGLAEEWEKLDEEDILTIQDDSAVGNKYKAYLVSMLDDEELPNKYKGKIRKGSFAAFRTIITMVFKEEPDDLETLYVATSDLTSKAPTSEAYITLFCRFLTHMQPLVTLTTGHDYCVEYFQQNCINLPQFQKMTHFNDGTRRVKQDIDVAVTPEPTYPGTVPVNPIGHMYPHQQAAAEHTQSQWMPHQLATMGAAPGTMYPHQAMTHHQPYPHQPVQAPQHHHYYQQAAAPAPYPYQTHMVPGHPVQPVHAPYPGYGNYQPTPPAPDVSI